MSGRLIKALQRGGCTAEAADGRWPVWRQSDRRGRIIGYLPVNEVEILRLNGQLAPRGVDGSDGWIWVGPLEEAASDTVMSARALVGGGDRPHGGPAPLLQRVLDEEADPRTLGRLAQAARDYREDVERAEHSGRPSGMNWQALAAGTRIDGGGRISEQERISYAAAAAARLQRIQDLLGRRDAALLGKLVIEAATRHAIGRRFGWSAAVAHRAARAVLVRLADIYDREVTRPQRATTRLP